MDKESGLETLSQNLISKTNSNRLIMKLGNNGFIAYDRDENNRIISQSFPSLSVNPVDVAGAGDSLNGSDGYRIKLQSINDAFLH